MIYETIKLFNVKDMPKALAKNAKVFSTEYSISNEFIHWDTGIFNNDENCRKINEWLISEGASKGEFVFLKF